MNQLLCYVITVGQIRFTQMQKLQQELPQYTVLEHTLTIRHVRLSLICTHQKAQGAGVTVVFR